MVPQASEKCGLLLPDHQQIGCCASNSLNSEQVPDTFSALTISSRSPQASAQSEKRFLTPFLSSQGLGLGQPRTAHDLQVVVRCGINRISMTYIPYDPATFPDEINHPSGQTLDIDRSRLVVFNLDAVTALSLGEAASQAQRSIVESLLQQPRQLAVRKAASIGRELGIRIEDGADQPNASKINHTPWQLWLRSEAGEAITQQRLTQIGEQFRAALDWPRLLVGSVYRIRQTTGTTSLLSPLPHVLGVRLRASVTDQGAKIAERLLSRYGLMESDISRFLPRQYRCFILKDFMTQPVYRLPATIMDQEKDHIEEVFFDYMPLFAPTAAFVPNDKYYQMPTSSTEPYQWNLYKIKTQEGWNLQTPTVDPSVKTLMHRV